MDPALVQVTSLQAATRGRIALEGAPPAPAASSVPTAVETVLQHLQAALAGPPSRLQKAGSAGHVILRAIRCFATHAEARAALLEPPLGTARLPLASDAAMAPLAVRLLDALGGVPGADVLSEVAAEVAVDGAVIEGLKQCV